MPENVSTAAAALTELVQNTFDKMRLEDAKPATRKRLSANSNTTLLQRKSRLIFQSDWLRREITTVLTRQRRHLETERHLIDFEISNMQRLNEDESHHKLLQYFIESEEELGWLAEGFDNRPVDIKPLGPAFMKSRLEHEVLRDQDDAGVESTAEKQDATESLPLSPYTLEKIKRLKERIRGDD